MRKIEALKMPDVSPAVIASIKPEIRAADPRNLWVDETYQRGLSERSVRLIRKIVAEWDWTAFKPPIVVDVDGRLEVVDGQHTAIAAVTHGEIESIPVMIINAALPANRAAAFVRHNRDRIQVTATQLHSSLVAAGDEDALTMHQVCERAGAKILRNPPQMGRFKPGETLAIAAIRSLVNRRHAAGARKVIEVCVKAGAAPVSADLIKAVEHLTFAKEYAGEIDAERLVLIIASRLSALEVEAARFAVERKMPRWRALASIIFMNRRKTRHG